MRYKIYEAPTRCLFSFTHCGDMIKEKKARSDAVVGMSMIVLLLIVAVVVVAVVITINNKRD